MKVGIYGGTFDPPHLGHMRAAQAALTILGLDELLFIPACVPPHKETHPDSASAADRLAMTKLMADGMQDPRVKVSDLELERTGKSYTADTLRELKAQRPEDEWFLLMGTDMFLTLQNWYDPQTIADLATLAPFARTESDCGELFQAQGEYLSRTFGARTCAIQLPQITDLSSTQLRAALHAGQGGEHLWCQVYGYILRHGLYGLKSDLKHLSDADLRAASYSMVRAKRIPHIRGCEEEAVRLAERWGACVEETRRAAILHDCTNYLDLDEQLALCAQYQIPLDEMERSAVKLLHAKTGAAIAKYVYGESDQVYQAIFYHTTGRAGMSRMEKILYLADYIEPNRDFPEVEEMRALAYQDLDRAVAMGAALSIQEMQEKQYPLHPNTLECYQSLTGESL